MNDAVSQQYVVMTTQMTAEGTTMQPVDAAFETLDAALAVAQGYAEWQIMEIAVRVIRTDKDIR
jgi:hypothetical protein